MAKERNILVAAGMWTVASIVIVAGGAYIGNMVLGSLIPGAVAGITIAGAIGMVGVAAGILLLKGKK